ncbi:MAG: O-antigen ligase family protein [Planctomycetaceae bacterium]
MKGLIFTVSLAYGGALVSLFSPFYGLLIYVCFAIVRPEDMWPWAVQGGNYSRIIAIAMLGGWMLHIGLTFLTGKGVNFRFGAGKTVVLLFLGFWLWSVYLATQATSSEHAWHYVETLGKILLPFLVGMTTIDSVKRLKQLAWVIVVSQGYVAYEMNSYYFGGYNKLWMDGFGGVDNNSNAIALVTVIGLAAFMFLNVEKLWQKGIIGLCGAFMGHAVLFSFSRGGMVALIVCAGVGFFLLKKSTRHYLAFGLACIGMVYLAGPEVRDRFMRTFEENKGKREASAQSRIDLWADCWTVLQEDPVMGCGPNHWPLMAHRFGWERGKEAHSLWVQTATETGFVGIFLFAGFYAVCMWRLWLLIRRATDDEDPWFADTGRMVIAGLCGFGVAAQFVSLEALEVPYYVALLGAATLAVHSKVKREAEEEEYFDEEEYYEDDEHYYEESFDPDEQWGAALPAPV